MSTTEPIRDYDELQKFKNYYLSEEPQYRNYLLIIMGLNTALRISDLLRIKYEDVYHFDRKCFRKHLHITEQKTGKHNIIFLNEEVRSALTPVLEKGDVSGNQWIFTSQKKGPLSRQHAYRIIRRAADKSGISEHVSCHSLRKTFGYYAWKNGIMPAMLMEIYNHTSYSATKRYLGIEQDDKDDVYKNTRI